MPTAKQYRAKAAEYTELLKTASLPSEAREFRNLEQSFITLAENDEWLADNIGKTNSPGADDDWYGDLPRSRQEKNALGRLGTADPLSIGRSQPKFSNSLMTPVPGEACCKQPR